MAETKMCPLFKAKCLQKKCMFYIKSYHEKKWNCAIAWIGENSAFDIEEAGVEED